MTVISPNRVFSVNTLLELRDEFEDETLGSINEDVLPDKGGLLVKAQIQPFLEALPGHYWWHYNHEEYQPAEITVVELDEKTDETWESVAGVLSSNLPNGCPKCGLERLTGVQNEKSETSISHTGSTTYNQDTLIETRFSQVDCPECELVIVEDSELTEEAQELME